MQTDGKKKKRKKASKRKPSGWRQYDGRDLQNPDLWHPGDPLTEEDEKLLKPVLETYEKLGYVPAKREVKNKGPIGARFRIWSHVIQAAGLPSYSDPDETRRRMTIQEERKRREQERQDEGNT